MAMPTLGSSSNGEIAPIDFNNLHGIWGFKTIAIIVTHLGPFSDVQFGTIRYQDAAWANGAIAHSPMKIAPREE